MKEIRIIITANEVNYYARQSQANRKKDIEIKIISCGLDKKIRDCAHNGKYNLIVSKNNSFIDFDSNVIKYLQENGYAIKETRTDFIINWG